MLFKTVILFAMIAGAAGAQVSIDDEPTNVLRQSFHHIAQVGEYVCKPGSNFKLLTSLRTTFSIKHPTVFKVTFQGSTFQSNEMNLFLQIMVNNHLIIGNKLVSNIFDADYLTSAAGGYIHTRSGQYSHVIASRVAVVYLAAGDHTFDIGVKTVDNSATIREGTVLFELAQYNSDVSIGLPLYASNGAVIVDHTI